MPKNRAASELAMLRWSKVSLEERSRILREVRKKGLKKKRKEAEDSS